MRCEVSKGTGRLALELIGAPNYLTGDHELPETEISEIHAAEFSILHHGSADIHGMFDAVGLAFFEIVGEISLGNLLLLVQVSGDGFINMLQAGLEGPAVAVDSLHVRIQGSPV